MTPSSSLLKLGPAMSTGSWSTPTARLTYCTSAPSTKWVLVSASLFFPSMTISSFSDDIYRPAGYATLYVTLEEGPKRQAIDFIIMDAPLRLQCDRRMTCNGGIPDGRVHLPPMHEIPHAV
ncbi:hypothetical protein AXF42_Ash013526 [Apostasia shenzhenica]|uniref:Uncharacterized protein n=1 Tax=Apostasia shenzhenica TaxID=1088818 RepID=A0A2I0AP59_9ASPA|nr:hypothetical protein AXF42_Ash013526 [Apostasia shenzhenica]